MKDTTEQSGPLLIGVEDLAKLLGVAPVTVRRQREAGNLPPSVRIGRLVRWPRAAIERWVAAGCPRPRAK